MSSLEPSADIGAENQKKIIIGFSSDVLPILGASYVSQTISINAELKP